MNEKKRRNDEAAREKGGMKKEGEREFACRVTPWLLAARSGAPVARSTVKSTANALEYFFLVGRERKGDHERARGT